MASCIFLDNSAILPVHIIRLPAGQDYLGEPNDTVRNG